MVIWDIVIINDIFTIKYCFFFLINLLKYHRNQHHWRCWAPRAMKTRDADRGHPSRALPDWSSSSIAPVLDGMWLWVPPQVVWKWLQITFKMLISAGFRMFFYGSGSPKWIIFFFTDMKYLILGFRGVKFWENSKCLWVEPLGNKHWLKKENNMELAKNRGTPKSSSYWGIPMNWEIPRWFWLRGFA